MIIESDEFKEVKNNVTKFVGCVHSALKGKDIYLHYNGKAILIFRVINGRAINENAFSFFYKAVTDKEIRKNKKSDRFLEYLQRQLDIRISEL